MSKNNKNADSKNKQAVNMEDLKESGHPHLRLGRKLIS